MTLMILHTLHAIVNLCVMIVSGCARSVKTFTQHQPRVIRLMTAEWYGVNFAPMGMLIGVMYVSPILQDTHMAQMIVVILSVKVAMRG